MNNNPISIQDALVFACRSVEAMAKRLDELEGRLIVQGNGQELNDLSLSNKNKIENLLNRLSAIEKDNVKKEVHAETLKHLDDLRKEFQTLQTTVNANNQVVLNIDDSGE
jgi:hypothetical protein